jgi:DNA polymerase-1
VDADFLVYRIGFASEDDDEQYARSRVTEWLTDMVYFDLKAEDYKAWITGKDNFRYQVAVTHPYKGNRKDLKKPKHYEALRGHLERLGAVVTVGEEADDAVGIESAKGNYWIVHVDKDLDQLPGWHYNPVKKEEYYVDEFQGLKNFYLQVLTGDRTDWIFGIKGVGPVKAAKILEGTETEEEMYSAVCKAYEKYGESIDRVHENGKLLWLRRKEGEIWTPPKSS